MSAVAFVAPSPTPFLFFCALTALAWALYQFQLISQTKVEAALSSDSSSLHDGFPLTGRGSAGVQTPSREEKERQFLALKEVYEAISRGADAFLHAEYMICGQFVVGFSIIIFALISWGQGAGQGFLTTLSFILGAATSVLSGYIGMRVAVYSNVRTTINAMKGGKDGYVDCFNTAFRAGSVMGFALTGLGILVMYVTLIGYSNLFEADNWSVMMDCISGYGLGGSSIAMFGRVGGGIYTKAADVGADLCGKVIQDLPEDSPRNPATIADNVGDNVGDIAGMGADLFGSFAESTCAALVIAAQTDDLRSAGWGAVCFPLVISAVGVLVCILSSFVSLGLPDFIPTPYAVTKENRIEFALRLQLIITTLLLIPATMWMASAYLPATFHIQGVSKNLDATRFDAVVCICMGSFGGLIIGLVTEYYTSKEYNPVKDLAYSCKDGGAAINIINGLALGYRSAIIPTFMLATIVYTAFELCDLYGVALAAVGMLGNLATGLTIDAYGPVCDNAGGIAEMAELPHEVRVKTDALDAAGNTTAAVGKGFAIGSAALVSLALYGAFVVRIRETSKGVGNYENVYILEPLTFAFLLVGSMLPYWFSAMTMKSVAKAAKEMVQEVQRQFNSCPDCLKNSLNKQLDPPGPNIPLERHHHDCLLNPHTSKRPDYEACVSISTKAALAEMIAPGALVLLSPLVVGTFFGVTAVYGLLTGALLSGVQLAISMSNTGGAWDNAKKYISGNTDPSLGGKGSETYKAAVIGDTVGDPLKDTSGPALNILMKLMAIISLVFADFFFAINQGEGLLQMPKQ